MYVLTDSNDERLLAEAESLEAARLAARTMWAEGEQLPILLWLGETQVERFIIDSQSGRPVFQGTQGFARSQR